MGVGEWSEFVRLERGGRVRVCVWSVHRQVNCIVSKRLNLGEMNTMTRRRRRSCQFEKKPSKQYSLVPQYHPPILYPFPPPGPKPFFPITVSTQLRSCLGHQFIYKDHPCESNDPYIPISRYESITLIKEACRPFGINFGVFGADLP